MNATVEILVPAWTRADCATLPKPCMITTCRYNFRSPVELHGCGRGRPRTGDAATTRDPAVGCVLDWLDANPGPHTLEEVGILFGVTRERIRQIEAKGLKNLEKQCRRAGLHWSEIADAVGVRG